MNKLYLLLASGMMFTAGYGQVTNGGQQANKVKSQGNLINQSGPTVLPLTNGLTPQTTNVQVQTSNKQVSTTTVTTTTNKVDKNTNHNHEFCKSHELTKAMYEEQGVYDAFYQDYLDGAQQAKFYTQPKTPGTNTIAIVFHVVHEGEPLGTGTNVSNADIMTMYTDLVEDFSLTNADQSLARTGLGFNPADAGINFCLATQDPLGIPLTETGVTRIATSQSWFDSDNPAEVNAMKSAPLGQPIWDRDKYLNVWICDISNGAGSGTAGYAYKPSISFLPSANIDGIVVDYNLGVNNDNVLTHEVGHYLGLDHTWGGSGSCILDDGFTDTPNTDGPSFNNPNSCNFGVGQQNCPGIETQFENYMDYANCTVMFTTEQSNFMNTILSGIRSSLLLSPGCDPAGPPICSFVSSPAGPGPVIIPESGTVVFTDQSTGGPTSWTWTISGTQGVDWDFTGGTNANSQNPQVTFYNLGFYDVTMTASNGFGACAGVIENSYVQVVAPAAGTGCDTLRNWDPAQGFFVWNAPAAGWGSYPGHANNNGTTITSDSYAERFNYVGSAEVRRLRIPIFLIDTNAVSAGNITFTIWSDVAGPEPGVILATEVVNVRDLNDFAYNIIDFTTPATVSGNFWAGYQLQYDADQDTVEFVCTNTITGGNDSWMMELGAIAGWTDMNALTGGTPPGSIAMDVLLSNGPSPVADFQFDDDSLCDGGSIVVNASGSTNVTDYEWYLTDDPITTTIATNFTAGTSFSPSPAGDFLVFLFTEGSCETDALFLPVTVLTLPNMTVNVTNTTCGLNNGAVTFTAPTGGDGVTYEYSMDGVAWSGTTSYSNLPAGNYTAYVRTDGDACETQINFTINTSVPLSGTATVAAGICPGGNTNLTASGGTGYTWYDGATVIGSTATINVAPTVTTTYTVEITDGTCTDVQYSIVTVNPLPTVDAGVDQTVCAGTAATLSGSGAVSYTWDNGVTDGVSFTPGATTTYTVTGTDANGCQNTDQAIITVNALPAVSAGADQAVCTGNSVTLSGSGAVSYTWDNGVTDGVAFTPGATTTYTVTGTDVNGCQNTDQAIVTVNSLPTVSAGADQGVCTGGSVTLNGSGAVSYNWDNGVTDGVAFTPGATTTYTVTGTDGNGCQNTDQVIVTVNSLPTVSAGADQSVCAGGSVTLNGSGAVSYTWDNGVTNGVAFSPGATTTYTVTGTDGNGCQNTDQAIVTVDPLPTVSAGTDVAVCTGGSVTLTGSGAVSYTWDNGVTDGVAFTPGATTTYTVTGTDGNGCQNTDQVLVTVNSLPTVSAGADQATCPGGSVTLNGSGAVSYTWDNGVTDGVAFTPGATTTYTVTGTDGNGCQNTDQAIVTVNALPTVSAGVDQTVCDGSSVTLNGSGASSYTWDNGVTDGVAFTPGATTTYTVTGTDGNGCQNTDQVIVTVNAAPTTSALSEVCNGTNTAYNVIFTVNGGLAPYSVAGGTGSFAGNIWTNDLIASGTPYNLVVTDANGCSATPVSGVQNCACTTDAGTMNTGSTLTLCGNGAITAVHNGDQFLDGDDALEFYLHDLAGTVIGTVSGTNGTPTFSFTGGMTYGTTYYISSVVGNDIGGGVVDLADPCLSVSSGTAVIWYDIPTVGAGADQSVCDGASVTLSGSGAISYSWDNGVTDGAAFTATATTTYTVTGTDANGCQNTDQATITVNPLPTVGAGTDVVVCDGNTVTLSGTGATSYTWDNGVTDGVAFTPTASTTYTVTGTDVNGCQGTDQVLVTVNSTPTVGAGVDQSVCAGGSVTLSGSGATSYTWDNGVTDGVAFTPASTTTYTVTGTDGNGCQNTDQVIVTVNALPTVGAGTDQSICVGGTVTLSGSGATSYSWDNGVTDGIAFSPGATTTYTVTGTDGNGCQNTDQVIVTVNTAPTVDAGVDQAVCAGNTVTLSGSGAVSYTWDNGVTDGVAFSPTLTTTYTVTGTDVNGCQNTDQVIVTVNSLPSVSAGVDQAVCDGNAVTLSGSGATSYTWDNGVTDGVSFTPTATTTYTVTGTDVNGCQNTDQVDVTVNPLPTVDGGVDQAACSGAAVTLAGSGAASYTWDNGITDGVAFTPTVTTTYTVTGTDVNGCQNTDQVVVTIGTLPTVDAGVDQTVCDGASVTLSGAGALTYTWDNGVTDGVAFTATTTTTYTVTGTDVNGCQAGDQVVVTVNPLPTVDAGLDTTICNGGSIVLNGSGATSYTWDNGVTDGVSFSPTATTTYTVTGTDGNGCQNTAQVTVTLGGGPVVTGLITHDDGSTNGTIDVTITGATGPITISWDNAATTEDLIFLAAGDYTITVTDSLGCETIVTFTVLSTVGFEDNALEGLTIYPNPSNGEFNIQLEGYYEMEVTDARGRLVIRQNGTENTTINLSAYEDGIYFIRIIKDGEIAIRKLMKQ